MTARVSTAPVAESPHASVQHHRALMLMLVASFLWSIAGVFTRHLDRAQSWEVAFWRSLFAMIFMMGVLVWGASQTLSI